MVKRRTSLTLVTDGSGEVVRAVLKTPNAPKRAVVVVPAKKKPVRAGTGRKAR